MIELWDIRTLCRVRRGTNRVGEQGGLVDYGPGVHGEQKRAAKSGDTARTGVTAV